MSEYELEPVGPGQLASVERLFGQTRATQHCWCTAFCSTRWQFAAGWYGGGNKRRFEAITAAEQHPMGLLAIGGQQPVGWCACGPRVRYPAALTGRSAHLADRPRDEDDQVWLIACLFVRPDHRAVFGHLGFRRIDRPHPERVIMRLELSAPAIHASGSS